jgi:DNA repair exonuclease SbcCD ATPase subunit
MPGRAAGCAGRARSVWRDVILDEVFGSQDLDRRSTLLEYLRRLEEEFEQVFVISHFGDVTAACDVQFEMQKTGGISEVVPV